MKCRGCLVIFVWLVIVAVIQSPSLAQSENIPIIGMDWSDDGTKLAVVDSKRLTIFTSVRDIRPFTPVALRLFPSDSSHEFAQPYFSPDGRRILVNNEIWDSQTVETLLKIDTNGYMPQWSSDGSAIAFRDLGNRGTSIYSTQNGVLLRHFTTGIWRAGTEPLWSPNNEYFVTISGLDEVLLLDAISGGEVVRYKLENEIILSMAWSPDSTRLALGRTTDVQLGSPNSYPNTAAYGGARRNSITILDVNDGHIITNVSGFRDPVDKLAWSPDGHQLAGVDFARLLYIWDADTGTLVDSYFTPPFLTQFIKFSPYGGRLMIGLDTRKSLSRTDTHFIPKSTFAQSSLDDAIQVMAPDVSPDRLLKILSQCVSDQTTLITAKEYIDAGQFRAFISWASHVSINVVPEVCAADLQLMAQAIIGIEIRPSVAQAPTASIVN